MTLEGGDALRKRLKAIGDTRGLLQTIQLRAVAEAKQLVPRKTGSLGRSIAPGGLGRDFAIVRARMNYAAHVEYGTRPHLIRPRKGRVLAWPAAGGARLSGRPRKGAKMIFARLVRHPGTRAQPYLIPGAIAALRSVGLNARVVNQWNRAA